MGLAGGFKFSMDQNINVHQVGPLGGTPAVNGAGQTGSTLNTNGWTAAAASRLKKGDIFTIAGVNAVNPQTRQTTGQPSLHFFCVSSESNPPTRECDDLFSVPVLSDRYSSAMEVCQPSRQRIPRRVWGKWGSLP